MNPSRVAVSSSRCAKDQKYREGVTCASVVLPEKLCVEIPTQPNPPPLRLWSVQGSQGSVAGSERAVSGTGTGGL